MKILYLTFYFEPDLCPGSFRSTALIAELGSQLSPDDHIHVVTTQPNRYQSFSVTAPEREQRGGVDECPVTVERVAVPAHASGFIDQIRSFAAYFWAARRLAKERDYDMVVATSSRLFTAFLGAVVARERSIPLFLDVRDLFRETILEVLKRKSGQGRQSRIGALWLHLQRLLLKPILGAVERYTFGCAKHINLVSRGFRPYFQPFSQATYSYFTNGIDDEFLGFTSSGRLKQERSEVRTILYAGNIGEGQGLHKIVPQAARQLGEGYRFVIIGDGGAKSELEEAIRVEGVANVHLRLPVSRRALIQEYQWADYLFVHLNDLEAFRRVLPSKLFEYGATDKPVVAGVSGCAASFVQKYLDNSLLFNPGDVDGLVTQLRQTPYRTQYRNAFIQRFQRKTIMQQLSQQIRRTAPASPDKLLWNEPSQPQPAMV